MATPVRKPQVVEVQVDSAGRELRESYKIKSTTHYEWFKFIDGNRDTKHAAKIKKSIEAVGLLICPILCNERFEIIDGQGRFTACKELGLPVYYVQQKGIGIEEVRKMNSVSSNWTTGNYVHSYTEGDDTKESYIFLQSLQKQFPDFSYTFLASVANKNKAHSETVSNIKNGNFVCTLEGYENAIAELTYLNQFVKCVLEMGGKSDYVFRALDFCYDNEQVDNDYLLRKFKQGYTAFPEVASIRGALESIQKAYNNHQDADHEPIFIISDFDRYLMSVKKKNMKKGRQ